MKIDKNSIELATVLPLVIAGVFVLLNRIFTK